MIISLLLFIFLIISVRIYFAMSEDIDQKMQELQALRLENDRRQCEFFNATLSSNMKETVVQKQYVDNKPGPVKWIKRDI